MGMRTRDIVFVRLAAVAVIAAGSAFFWTAPAFAQACSPTSTQATCACPTAGGGLTCFNGQIFRASSVDCVLDARSSCAPNQGFDCSTLTCVCGSGTSFCASTEKCVADLSCSQGAVFDACANRCVSVVALKSAAADHSTFYAEMAVALLAGFLVSYVVVRRMRSEKTESAQTRGMHEEQK